MTEHPSQENAQRPLAESFGEKDISFPCPLYAMGKGRKYAQRAIVRAVSEGLTKTMPPSPATGMVFVAGSHCGSGGWSESVREAIEQTMIPRSKYLPHRLDPLMTLWLRPMGEARGRAVYRRALRGEIFLYILCK